MMKNLCNTKERNVSPLITLQIYVIVNDEGKLDCTTVLGRTLHEAQAGQISQSVSAEKYE